MKWRVAHGLVAAFDIFLVGPREASDAHRLAAGPTFCDHTGGLSDQRDGLKVSL